MRLRALAIPVAAIALATPFAATGAHAATPSAPASSASTALVADAAYRGAEHIYMVENVAAASLQFGPKSKQVKAAAAALETNVKALATDLTENDVPAGAQLATLLLARDAALLDYATASHARHANAKGAAAGQHFALTELSDLSTSIGRELALIYPDTKGDEAAKLVLAVSAVDALALDAQARTGSDRFPKTAAASTLLSTTTTAIAAAEVAQQGHAADLLDPASLARIAGAVIATQHVYSVGQFLATSLQFGTQSGQSKAAQFWVNQNSLDVAKLFGQEGLNASLVGSAWTEHIAGYRLYVAGVATGHAGDTRQAAAYFDQYETTLANEIGAKIPGLPAATVRPEIVEHVTGTEAVAHELKAHDTAVYGDAEMGAQHLVDVFAQLAEYATVSPQLAQSAKIQRF